MRFLSVYTQFDRSANCGDLVVESRCVTLPYFDGAFRLGLKDSFGCGSQFLGKLTTALWSWFVVGMRGWFVFS